MIWRMIGRVSRWLGCAFAGLALAAGGFGQEPELVDRAAVQAALEGLPAPGQASELEASLRATYEQALTEFEQAAQAEARAAEFARAADEAPALEAAIRAELAKPPSASALALSAADPLEAIEAALAEAEAARRVAVEQLDALAAEAELRRQREPLIPSELAVERQREAELLDSLAALEASPANAARRALSSAQLAATRARIRALEGEQKARAARAQLAPLLRDRAARRVAEAQESVGALQALAREGRELEAADAAREALELREKLAHEGLLGPFAEENQALAAERTGSAGLGARTAELEVLIERDNALLRELREQSSALREKVAVGGRAEGVAVELRQSYADMPDVAALRRRREALGGEIGDAHLRWIELRELRDDWRDVEVQRRRMSEQVAAELGPAKAAELEPQIRSLVEARWSLLDDLEADARKLLERTTEYEAVVAELADFAAEYRSFIEEHILWVRSVFPDRLPSLRDARAALAWLFDPASWASGLAKLGYACAAAPFSTAFALLGVALAGALYRPGKRRLAALAKLSASFKTDGFRLTLWALAWTIVLAAFLPLALWTAGWLLLRPHDQTANLVALGGGLQRASRVLFALTFFRQMVSSVGLGIAHFRWRQASTVLVRSHVRWFIVAALPFAVLALTFDRQADAVFNHSAGRLAFGVVLALCALFAKRVLDPRGPVIREYLKLHSGQWIDRLRYVWYGLAVGLPLVFLTIALWGYYLTAFELQTRLGDTFAYVLVLVLVNELLHRWLFLARRRLSVEQARSRARAKTEGGETTPLDEDHVDIPAVDAQTKELFRSAMLAAVVAGFLLIWAELLPALRAFDRVQIWPELRVLQPVEGDEPAAAPGAEPAIAAARDPLGMTTGLASSATEVARPPAGVSLPRNVTLGDLGLAVLIAVATVIATRNIPGLLEILILQRLPLDSGSRYAIASVLRYTILIFGVTSTLAAIGIGWSKIQWLAAAFTFGLAFGLQEIFANFVSGLIILAERPIRIGDLVTVGDVAGRVTRIRMRATTVLDADRRELLVPNRDIITNQVINWTLSDPITRLVVPVRVAHGSDTRRVRELLLRAAREAPVLAEPAPSALFLRFGEGSLDFELYVYLATRDTWSAVVQDLHQRIDDLFREAEIELAASRLARIPEPGAAAAGAAEDGPAK